MSVNLEQACEQYMFDSSQDVPVALPEECAFWVVKRITSFRMLVKEGGAAGPRSEYRVAAGAPYSCGARGRLQLFPGEQAGDVRGGQAGLPVRRQGCAGSAPTGRGAGMLAAGTCCKEARRYRGRGCRNGGRSPTGGNGSRIADPDGTLGCRADESAQRWQSAGEPGSG